MSETVEQKITRLEREITQDKNDILQIVAEAEKRGIHFDLPKNFTKGAPTQ